MWIAFLPFPTGLLGNHPDQPCGGLRLRVRRRRYMPFFLRYALARLLLRPPHEKRNQRPETAPSPAAFAIFFSSLRRGPGRWVVPPVPRFVLIRCCSGVLHH